MALCSINPLNSKLIPIYHLLALLGAQHILHVSRTRVNLRTNKTLIYNFLYVFENGEGGGISKLKKMYYN